eukprot:scaffold5095_cov224-Pinguiococcus_pyrenoidosus.AAC.2
MFVPLGWPWTSYTSGTVMPGPVPGSGSAPTPKSSVTYMMLGFPPTAWQKESQLAAEALTAVIRSPSARSSSTRFTVFTDAPELWAVCGLRILAARKSATTDLKPSRLKSYSCRNLITVVKKVVSPDVVVALHGDGHIGVRGHVRDAEHLTRRSIARGLQEHGLVFFPHDGDVGAEEHVVPRALHEVHSLQIIRVEGRGRVHDAEDEGLVKGQGVHRPCEEVAGRQVAREVPRSAEVQGEAQLDEVVAHEHAQIGNPSHPQAGELAQHALAQQAQEQRRPPPRCIDHQALHLANTKV